MSLLVKNPLHRPKISEVLESFNKEKENEINEKARLYPHNEFKKFYEQNMQQPPTEKNQKNVNKIFSQN